MTRSKNPAERAGRAAKTARRHRRNRERVAGWAGALLLAIPLLFAAVWTRAEVSEELRIRDGLYAQRDSLEHSLLQLASRRTRLTEWNHVEQSLAGSGLRLPERPEVLWVAVPAPGRRGG